MINPSDLQLSSQSTGEKMRELVCIFWEDLKTGQTGRGEGFTDLSKLKPLVDDANLNCPHIDHWISLDCFEFSQAKATKIYPVKSKPLETFARKDLEGQE